jgi:steroid delta-isomerase-like uncharacterized protein
MKTISTNAEVLHRFVTAFNDHDLAELDLIIAPDFVDHHYPAGIPNGPAGVKMWLSVLWAAFDPQVTVDDVIAADDRVASRWTFTGTHVGPFNGFPATGLPFSIQIMSVERIVDGLIIERWETGDILGMFQQLNLLPTI